QIALASQVAGVCAAALTMRARAHRRLTAVGRVAPRSRATWSIRARNASRGAPRNSRVPATRPIAAAMPISGAPRTCSVRIASATASPLSRSRSIRASGRARWSTMRTAPDGLQAIACTLMARNITRNVERGTRNTRAEVGPPVPRSAFRLPRYLSPMRYETLLFEIRDAIALITINRPDKLNALNDQVVDELADAAGRVATEQAIGGAILTGSGTKAFVAGADIADLSKQGPFDGKARAQRGQAMLRRFETCGK